MKTKTKTSSTRLFALVTGLLLSGAAFAQDASTVLKAAAAGPTVSLIGSGCALNSGADLHWEGGVLVVNFGSMVAEKGDGISLVQSRKACNITLDLNVPTGVSYALSGYSAEGFDDLTGNDSRTLTVSNFFQGQGTTSTVKDSATGPKSDGFTARHSNNALETVWSPCNEQRAHTITASVRVASGVSRAVSSAATLDSLRLFFRIKPCTAP